jgi:hypothetical protein
MFSLDLGPRTAGVLSATFVLKKRYHDIGIGLSFVERSPSNLQRERLFELLPARPLSTAQHTNTTCSSLGKICRLANLSAKSPQPLRKQYWMDSGGLSCSQRRSHLAARVIPTRKWRKMFQTSFRYFVAGSIKDSNRQGDRIYRNR